MNINFEEKYKNYTNYELLQITQNPTDYQDGAVLAAATILKERNYLAEAVLEEQEHYLISFEKNHTGIEERIENLKSSFSKFFKDLAAPLTSGKPVKYINAILLIAIWFSLSQGYAYFKIIRFIIAYSSFVYDYPIVFFAIINLTVLIGGIYLFSKGEKMGWICLSIVILVTAFNFLLNLYYMHKSDRLVESMPLTVKYIMKRFLFVTLMISALTLLFKKEITGYYEISKKIILNTVTVALVIFLVIFLYWN